ncbi:hypothetical protein cyc_02548 [Cyclospora cayetanensis]|uniref:Uncharacterized protein n=1 Tax=Cyclospora cayetanensis TaxID=88456 RepID=A0A1D3CVH2_9EIME|nr:hypothetical protein cyc_02548 [Cyclospora cayetanensis]
MLRGSAKEFEKSCGSQQAKGTHDPTQTVTALLLPGLAVTEDYEVLSNEWVLYFGSGGKPGGSGDVEEEEMSSRLPQDTSYSTPGVTTPGEWLKLLPRVRRDFKRSKKDDFVASVCSVLTSASSGNLLLH